MNTKIVELEDAVSYHQENTTTEVREVQVILKFISILQNKFITKTRKSFHPPVIIKDAD